jgi:4-diphosphocytidyl-2-C-methyl-D-erythritol kinase
MSLTLRAAAKVNLGLEVTGRRPDGYHELRSIMVNVDIFDTLVIDPGEGTTVGGEAATGAIAADRELASLALRALETLAGRRLGMGLRLRKLIPLGAGLGGGSGDAAAVLRAAPRLGVEADSQRLAQLALELGADVPFQLAGGAALVGGVGELIEPLPYREIWLALAFGRVHVSTAAVFGELRPDEWSSGQGSVTASDAWRDGSPGLLEILGELPNSLWAPASRVHAGVLADQAAALELGGWVPRLTGSGGAMYQLCRDQAEARRLALSASTLGFMAWACRTLPAPIE